MVNVTKVHVSGGTDVASPNVIFSFNSFRSLTNRLDRPKRDSLKTVRPINQSLFNSK
jgi:hypothetical protein